MTGCERSGPLPRRPELESVCLIGSGPIVIGQACEFDYSGSQALKILRAEGLRTVVVNSNPATIMTDPGFADRTYLEPLDPECVAGVLERERPDALLPTMGGQTGLNVASSLAEDGVLEELGVELIGAPLDVIRRAEDRDLFRQTVRAAGLHVPQSVMVTSPADLPRKLSFPVILRPAFTLGGHGGGTAGSAEELDPLLERALHESPVGQVLVEESLIGWDEFELEVMRDRADNVVIVCSIENLDPMGIHTGDSVAKVAAKLALGYTLDEIPNDLTRTTPASFEPTLDYVVVKFPRFAFEKFPGADRTLGTQMKAVGEAMGIGRTFGDAFLKAMRAREVDAGVPTPWPDLDSVGPLDAAEWLRLKRLGLADADVARATGASEEEARARRVAVGVRATYR